MYKFIIGIWSILYILRSMEGFWTCGKFQSNCWKKRKYGSGFMYFFFFSLCIPCHPYCHPADSHWCMTLDWASSVGRPGVETGARPCLPAVGPGLGGPRGSAESGQRPAQLTHGLFLSRSRLKKGAKRTRWAPDCRRGTRWCTSMRSCWAAPGERPFPWWRDPTRPSGWWCAGRLGWWCSLYFLRLSRPLPRGW